MHRVAKSCIHNIRAKNMFSKYIIVRILTESGKESQPQRVDTMPTYAYLEYIERYITYVPRVYFQSTF